MDSVCVEILGIADCPNASTTRVRVQDALAQEAVPAKIVDVVVDTFGAAQELRFLGSPSVRINGKDIEPGASTRGDYALACRTYRDGSNLAGSPPLALIREAPRHIA